MRRITGYFMSWLTHLYRTNVLDWLSRQLDDNQRNNNSDKKRRKGNVLSLQILQANRTKNEVGRSHLSIHHALPWCFFSTHRGNSRSGHMNVTEIVHLEKVQAQWCVVLSYVKCELYMETEALMEAKISSIENLMTHCALLLQFIQDGNFEQ